METDIDIDTDSDIDIDGYTDTGTEMVCSHSPACPASHTPA